MIISRKRFQEEIAKALKEQQEQIWLDNKIRSIDTCAHRRMDELERRIYELERRANTTQVKCDVDNSLETRSVLL